MLPQSFLNSSTVMVFFYDCPGTLKVSVFGCDGWESTCILSDWESSKELTSAWFLITLGGCLLFA